MSHSDFAVQIFLYNGTMIAQYLLHSAALIAFALIPFWFRFTGFPVFSAFYSAGFPIFWAMLVTILAWGLTRFSGRDSLRQDRRRSVWALSLAGLAAWALLSWAWAYMRDLRPEVALSAAIPFVVTAAFALAVACAGPSRCHLAAVLILSLFLNSLLAAAQVALQRSVGLSFLGEFPLDPLQSGVAIVQADGFRWLRPYGLVSHPNILAGILVIGLLVLPAWIIQSRRWWSAVLAVAVTLVGLWALLLTFSRAAWISLAVAALVALILFWRIAALSRAAWTRLAITGLLAVGAGALFVLLYAPFLSARVGIETESIELRSLSDRAVFNQIAADAIQQSPLLGIGIGSFPWYASYYLAEKTDFDLRGQPVHNIYLSALSELGLVGLSLFLVALVAGIIAAFHVLTRSPQSERPLRIACVSAVLALLVIGFFDHYPWTLPHTQAALWGLLASASRPGP
jgi:O-antigen ligase